MRGTESSLVIFRSETDMVKGCVSDMKRCSSGMQGKEDSDRDEGQEFSRRIVGFL